MYDLMTVEQYNERYGVGLNTPQQEPAATQTAAMLAPANKSGFCPVRHAQQMDARHKIVSALHLVAMVLVVILLFRLAFK